MKTVNIFYWITTILIGGFMLFSGITNAMVNEGSVALISKTLGYPQYMIAFIGVAKILGSIAILVPGFPRLKEWAYAGLFFDLAGAAYSMYTQPGGFKDGWPMLLFIAMLFASYFLHHKRLQAKQKAKSTGAFATVG